MSATTRQCAIKCGLMRQFIYVVFAFATLLLFIIVFNYHTVATSFRAHQRYLNLHWESQTNSKSQRNPHGSYPWIDDSGQTVSGNKPPVYGLFVLLDLGNSSTMTSHNLESERFFYQDFGFPNCQQVSSTW